MTSYAGEVAFKGRVATILETVARECQLTTAALLSADRHKSVVEARQIAMFLVRELTTLSYPEAARALKRKDHGTIFRGVQKIRDNAIGNARLFALVAKLRREILSELAGSAA